MAPASTRVAGFRGTTFCGTNAGRNVAVRSIAVVRNIAACRHVAAVRTNTVVRNAATIRHIATVLISAVRHVAFFHSVAGFRRDTATGRRRSFACPASPRRTHLTGEDDARIRTPETGRATERLMTRAPAPRGR